MSSFKHKIISFPDIDYEKNFYLYNVCENYERLKDIYDGVVRYISSDYPTLINSFEQLYKGTAKELGNFYPELKVTEDALKIGHRFKQFSSIVNKKIPLSPTYEGYKKICECLTDLENTYNSGRYENHKSFDDFQRDYRRFECQLERIAIGLTKEYSKNVISEEDERDLEDW